MTRQMHLCEKAYDMLPRDLSNQMKECPYDVCNST
jgi:hypothetical protein